MRQLYGYYCSKENIMKNRPLYLLIIITFIASLLRLYRLDVIPPGINRDEASIGITASSLMTTGNDEYGRRFPLSFESFGDWKLPLYIYTTIPFIKIFGLTELAVRLPSALAGIASVIAIFFLARILFASETIALIASLALALSPWHIHISRVESEAIVAVFFAITACFFFLKGIKHMSLNLVIASSIIFSLTYYTYHGNHISTSLLVIGLTVIYWKDIIKIPRWWMAMGIGVFITGTILLITFSADHTKISGISIFGDPTVIHTQIELPRLSHNNPNSIPAILMHNRFTYAAITISQNYLKSYGPDFLFISGGGNRAHNIEGYGNLHDIESITLLLGFVWLILQITNYTANHRKEAKLILWWVLVGGVASAITKDAPHSNRMLMVVPALAIMTGAGTYFLIHSFSRSWKKTVIAILALGYIGGMSYYLDQYFIHFPKNEAKNWGYAYKLLTPVIFSQKNQKKNVIMTHPESSPYAYILFYSGYNMATYQKQATRYLISSDGYTDVSGFGRFSFRPINWDTDPSTHNTLLITTQEELPSALEPKVIAKILLPTNDVQFVVIDTDK